MHFNQRSCARIPRVCFRSLGRFQQVDMCPSMDPAPFPRETREESSKRDEGWGQTGRLEEAAGCEGSRGVERWETRTQRRPHPRRHCQCTKIKNPNALGLLLNSPGAVILCGRDPTTPTRRPIRLHNRYFREGESHQLRTACKHVVAVSMVSHREAPKCYAAPTSPTELRRFFFSHENVAVCMRACEGMCAGEHTRARLADTSSWMLSLPMLGVVKHDVTSLNVLCALPAKCVQLKG